LKSVAPIEYISDWFVILPLNTSGAQKPIVPVNFGNCVYTEYIELTSNNWTCSVKYRPPLIGKPKFSGLMSLWIRPAICNVFMHSVKLYNVLSIINKSLAGFFEGCLWTLFKNSSKVSKSPSLSTVQM